MKDEELDFQSKKLRDFNAIQADIISERIIQKITKQFANHLKGEDIDAACGQLANKERGREFILDNG